MTIGIFANKGGVLKTTISLNLAFMISLLKTKSKIVVIELDPQKNLKTAFGVENNNPRENIELIEYQKNNINKIEDLKKKYNYIIIDNPSYINEEVSKGLEICHKIIVPSQLEELSIKGLLNLYEIFKEEITNKITAIVPVLFDSRTKIHKNNLMNLQTFINSKNIFLSNPLKKTAKNNNALDKGKLIVEADKEFKLIFNRLAKEISKEKNNE